MNVKKAQEAKYSLIEWMISNQGELTYDIEEPDDRYDFFSSYSNFVCKWVKLMDQLIAKEITVTDFVNFSNEENTKSNWIKAEEGDCLFELLEAVATTEEEKKAIKMKNW